MFLKVLGIVFFGGALVSALFWGWGYSVGDAFYRNNAEALGGVRTFIYRYAFAELWEFVIRPFFDMPLWILLTLIGLVFFVSAALRPGKG